MDDFNYQSNSGNYNLSKSYFGVNSTLIKAILFVSVLIVVLLLGVVSYVALSGDTKIEGAVTSGGEVVKVFEGEPGEENVVVTLPPGTGECGDKGCFREKFASCEKSAFTDGVGDKFIIFYEILGEDGDRCEVRTVQIKHIFEDWVGKQMVCSYDNEIIFDLALGDRSQCLGALNEAMNNIASKLL